MSLFLLRISWIGLRLNLRGNALTQASCEHYPKSCNRFAAFACCLSFFKLWRRGTRTTTSSGKCFRQGSDGDLLGFSSQKGNEQSNSYLVIFSPTVLVSQFIFHPKEVLSYFIFSGGWSQAQAVRIRWPEIKSLCPIGSPLWSSGAEKSMGFGSEWVQSRRFPSSNSTGS